MTVQTMTLMWVRESSKEMNGSSPLRLVLRKADRPARLRAVARQNAERRTEPSRTVEVQLRALRQ